MNRFTYFAAALDGGPIKIGRSSNVEQRISHLASHPQGRRTKPPKVEVLVILHRLLTTSESAAEIGAQFGVSRQWVDQIAKSAVQAGFEVRGKKPASQPQPQKATA